MPYANSMKSTKPIKQLNWLFSKRQFSHFNLKFIFLQQPLIKAKKEFKHCQKKCETYSNFTKFTNNKSCEIKAPFSKLEGTIERTIFLMTRQEYKQQFTATQCYQSS